MSIRKLTPPLLILLCATGASAQSLSPPTLGPFDGDLQGSGMRPMRPMAPMRPMGARDHHTVRVSSHLFSLLTHTVETLAATRTLEIDGRFRSKLTITYKDGRPPLQLSGLTMTRGEAVALNAAFKQANLWKIPRSVTRNAPTIPVVFRLETRSYLGRRRVEGALGSVDAVAAERLQPLNDHLQRLVDRFRQVPFQELRLAITQLVGDEERVQLKPDGSVRFGIAGQSPRTGTATAAEMRAVHDALRAARSGSELLPDAPPPTAGPTVKVASVTLTDAQGGTHRSHALVGQEPARLAPLVAALQAIRSRLSGAAELGLRFVFRRTPRSNGVIDLQVDAISGALSLRDSSGAFQPLTGTANAAELAQLRRAHAETTFPASPSGDPTLVVGTAGEVRAVTTAQAPALNAALDAIRQRLLNPQPTPTPQPEEPTGEAFSGTIRTAGPGGPLMLETSGGARYPLANRSAHNLRLLVDESVELRGRIAGGLLRVKQLTSPRRDTAFAGTVTVGSGHVFVSAGAAGALPVSGPAREVLADANKARVTLLAYVFEGADGSPTRLIVEAVLTRERRAQGISAHVDAD